MSRGFTLVEMMMVLALISIITVVAITGQSAFNQTLLLTDTAYTVALSTRDAQSYGIGSKTFAGITNAGYGVHFTGGASSYSVFSDLDPIVPGSSLGGLCPGHTVATGPEAKPGDCIYSPGRDGLVQTYAFSRGYTIEKVCGTVSSGVVKCTGTDFDSVDVLFLRPNTVTTMLGIRGGSYAALTSVRAYIKAPNTSAKRCVTISQAGQVGVSSYPSTACP